MNTPNTDDTKQPAGVPRMGLMGIETWTPYGQRRDSDGAQVILARSSHGYSTEFPHYEWATMPYPHLAAMSTDDLATMLRCAAVYPEDVAFAKAIAKTIALRKP